MAKKATKGSADVRIGEPVKKTVRVKINVLECQKKEAEVVKKEIKVKKIQLQMAPLKQEITKINKEIDKLCADVDSSTEEQTVKVREEFHYKKNVVRTVRADTGELVEERTMSKEDLQMDLTQTPGGKTKAPRKAANPAWQEALEASDAQDGPEAEA